MAYGRSKRPVSRKQASRTAGRVARTSALVQRKKKRATAVAAARQLALTPVAKALIDRRINKNVEIREKDWTFIENVTFDGPIGGDDLYPLLRNHAGGSITWLKGDGPRDREGDKIKLKSCTITLYIRHDPDLAAATTVQSNNQLEVYMGVFTPKNYRFYNKLDSSAQTEVANQLFRYSLDEHDPYDGTFRVATGGMNPTEVIRHWQRRFIDVRDDVEWAGDFLSGAAGIVYKPYLKKVVINLKVRNKVVHFQDTNWPIDFNPVFCCGYMNLNPAARPDATPRINVSGRVKIRWDNM